MELKRKTFPGTFIDLHHTIAAAGGDRLIYYSCRFHCSESMRLAALLGYDGPVKVWFDGRQMFHYRNGINPAVIDAQKIRFEAAKGEHELLIALGTNDGKAWGIFLRLERLDVAPKQLKRKSEAIIFPELL